MLITRRSLCAAGATLGCPRRSRAPLRLSVAQPALRDGEVPGLLFFLSAFLATSENEPRAALSSETDAGN